MIHIPSSWVYNEVNQSRGGNLMKKGLIVLLLFIILSFSACASSDEVTITFDSLGGEEVEPILATPHQTINLPTTTKEGYTFKGWYSGSGINDAQFTNLTVVTNDLTLYAKWDINQYTMTFRNYYDIYETKTYDYGDVIDFPDVPYIPMYLVEGWYTDQDLTQKFTSETMPAENLVLYVHYRLNVLQQFDYYVTGEFSGWEAVYGNHDYRASLVPFSDSRLSSISSYLETAVYTYILRVNFSSESSGWFTYNGYEDTMQAFDGNLAFRVFRTEVDSAVPIWWGSQMWDLQNLTPDTVNIPDPYDYFEDELGIHNFYSTVDEPGIYDIVLVMYETGHLGIAVIPIIN